MSSVIEARPKADVQASSRDEVAEEMRLILMPHKCKCLPSNDNRFRREETIYSVLHCVLSEDKNLRKRTYLSRYLMPIDVSMEYLSMQANGNLKELLEANQGVARGSEILSSVLFLVI